MQPPNEFCKSNYKTKIFYLTNIRLIWESRKGQRNGKIFLLSEIRLRNDKKAKESWVMFILESQVSWVWVDWSLDTATWNVKNIGTEVWHCLKFWGLVKPGISRSLHISFLLFSFFDKLFFKWYRPNYIADPIFKKISVHYVRLVGLENKIFSGNWFILLSVV